MCFWVKKRIDRSTNQFENNSIRGWTSVFISSPPPLPHMDEWLAPFYTALLLESSASGKGEWNAVPPCHAISKAEATSTSQKQEVCSAAWKWQWMEYMYVYIAPTIPGVNEFARSGHNLSFRHEHAAFLREMYSCVCSYICTVRVHLTSASVMHGRNYTIILNNSVFVFVSML